MTLIHTALQYPLSVGPATKAAPITVQIGDETAKIIDFLAARPVGLRR